MSDELAALQAEVAKLRQVVDEHRRSEIDRLRSELETALTAADHYRAEATRNADLGRQIYAEMKAKVDNLESQLKAMQQLPNGRPSFTRK